MKFMAIVTVVFRLRLIQIFSTWNKEFNEQYAGGTRMLVILSINITSMVMRQL